MHRNKDSVWLIWLVVWLQIFEKKPTTVKNFGIWVRYQSRTGYHNMYKEYRDVTLNGAVEQMYQVPTLFQDYYPSHRYFFHPSFHHFLQAASEVTTDRFLHHLELVSIFCYLPFIESFTLNQLAPLWPQLKVQKAPQLLDPTSSIDMLHEIYSAIKFILGAFMAAHLAR